MNIPGSFGIIFAVIYLLCVIAIIFYVLGLLTQFVRAHERVAGALEVIARKLRNDDK